MCLSFPLGKSVVSEQTDEMEASKRRPTGGGSERKRACECEKGNAASLRVFGNSWTPPYAGLANQQ